jgi:hypothetical protein
MVYRLGRTIFERSDAPQPRLGEQIILLFATSLLVALALGETLSRFRILTLLLLLVSRA